MIKTDFFLGFWKLTKGLQQLKDKFFSKIKWLNLSVLSVSDGSSKFRFRIGTSQYTRHSTGKGIYVVGEFFKTMAYFYFLSSQRSLEVDLVVSLWPSLHLQFEVGPGGSRLFVSSALRPKDTFSELICLRPTNLSTMRSAFCSQPVSLRS